MPKRSIWLRLTYAIDTPEPLPVVLLMGSLWWTIVGWLSHLTDREAVAWTLLLRHSRPEFWLTLWTSLCLLRFLSLFQRFRVVCQYINLLAIFNWCYAGWLLFAETELTLASGMCVVMGLVSLWCQVRSRRLYGDHTVKIYDRNMRQEEV